MIQETQILSDLIGTIYDTTLNRALWCEVLQRSAEFIGGSASSLYWKDATRRTGNPILHWNGRPDNTVPSYFDECVRIDPLTTSQFLFDIGQIYSIEDCMPYTEFVETRLYKEWVKPHGFVEQLAATIDKSTTSFSLFAIFRSEELHRPASEQARAPHRSACAPGGADRECAGPRQDGDEGIRRRVERSCCRCLSRR